jgi:hypothetical protein
MRTNSMPTLEAVIAATVAGGGGGFSGVAVAVGARAGSGPQQSLNPRLNPLVIKPLEKRVAHRTRPGAD